jgi:multidrug resistance efflux pump
MLMMGAGAVVALGLVIAGGRWWIEGRNFVSTNDAYVKGDIVAVCAKIAGRLATVKVATGKRVEAGELAAELDDADARIQVRQAEANLATARAGLGSARTSVALQAEQTAAQRAQAAAAIATARRNLEAARVARDRAATDVVRNERVFRAGGVSRQQLDAVRSALATAEAQMQAAASQVTNAEAGAALAASGQTQVRLREQAVETSSAQIAQAEAALAAARQQLAHTRVLVPVAGTIARVPSNPGEMIQPGQPIAQVVADGSLRVEAFLEETKVQRVHIGQAVRVDVDAYAGREYTGKVTDLGAATGSEFALIPQNNAAGNFTKVVQRLPIRIAVEDPNGDLKPGMSVTVHIDVRDAR